MNKVIIMIIPWSNFLINGKKPKTYYQLKKGADGVLWSRVFPRNKWIMILTYLLVELRRWITNHPDVH